MPHPAQPEWFEEEVRARSHAIWQSEGQKDGFSEEHWMRAAKQVEDECRAALEGTDAHFAPPRLDISETPIRQVASHAELDQGSAQAPFGDVVARRT